MAKAIISYDKDLPEIPDRRPWEKPTSFLVKDSSTESGWRVDASGRRPSRLLLIPKLRSAVDQWRDDGYPGASYESREQEWTPQNAIEALLGRKPAKDLAASQRSMLERIKELKDLVALNDEAHHVHDDTLAWNQSLLSIHRALPKGLSLWLDFSATPKDQNGMYFPWTVCDYPLAQAVEDRIVKAPIIVTKEDDPRQPARDPDHITRDNVAEKYGYWIRAAVQRWKEHDQTYRKLGTRPVLFIMAERNTYADTIGQYLWKSKEFGFKESEVLVIHTDTVGEITKRDLEKARQVARDIDQSGSPIKAIVSVMMLREGWDVRAVSVVLGLRPFTARAEILPEQVIGRGLRLMTAIGPDRTQTLEVLGTRNLLNVLREQLEFEKADFKLSATKPFQWRRNLPPLIAERTVFNYVATYNDFERRFAQFLDTAADVLRFASLGTTEQGDSGAQFRLTTSSLVVPLAFTIRTGWWSNKPTRASATGSSRPRGVSGRGLKTKMPRCATGVPVSRSRRGWHGHMSVSISLDLMHNGRRPWLR